ncbi:MAG: TIGR03617 family F420-dependent LLM class oxidoreductase [Frankia sp.]|nr:TIGR03617 family F420-dependent LLM class oxidoreductase [Frankia sp.]
MKIDHGSGGALDPRADAAAAEDAGFDAYWNAEIRHDPFVGLGLAATATQRVALGTCIAVAFARNPMSMAVVANDLQHLSSGRLMLGLGSQVRAHITRRFSMPWSRPAARMREYIAAMRAVWASWYEGTPLNFTGEFYQHTLMTPTFVPEPHPYGPPKVLLAGVGPAMTEVAGEVADGFLAHGFTTERYLREVTLPAIARGRARRADGLGERFEVVGSPLTATGGTEQELAAAIDRARGTIAFYGSTPAYRAVLELHGFGELGEQLHALSRQGRWAEMGRLIPDELVHEVGVVGEPDQIGPELVRRYRGVLDRIVLYGPLARDSATAAAIRAACAQPAEGA